MDARYQVKQYVGRVRGRRGTFRVFETGDGRYYLLSQVDDYDCDTGLQFPVLKGDLRPEVGYALRRGVSFDAVAFERFKESGGLTLRGAPLLTFGDTS